MAGSALLKNPANDPAAAAQQEFYVLEDNKRLSESVIWQVQRDYFQSAGVDAWRQGTVPHYITSNPTMARTYAEIVFGFFRDRAELANDASQPIYLLELGAGSGRFSYHFLKILAELCGQAAFQVPAHCYIISDFSSKNIVFSRQHTRLQPFIEQGLLDFAVFDAEKDTALRLQVSGDSFQPGSLSQPLVIFANYFFDSVPQDLFYLDGGKLSETRIGISKPVEPDQNSGEQTLNGMQVSYQEQPADLPYYHEASLDTLLAEYRQTLTGRLMFPNVGLRCLQRLRALSQEGILLLSADKGYHREEDLLNRSPGITPHGSFNVFLSVNYHAFRRYCEQQHGLALFPSHHHQSIDVACLLMLPECERYSETCLAHARLVTDFGPDDYFSLKKHFENTIASMSIGHILAYLRLSGYDARLMNQFMPQIRKVLPDSSPTERSDLLDMIHKVWSFYYPIGEDHDLAFDLGTLLYELDAYTEALVFFQYSLEAYGDSPATLYNMAMCHTQLNKKKKGITYLNKVLKIDPRHRAAVAMKQTLNEHGKALC